MILHEGRVCNVRAWGSFITIKRNEDFKPSWHKQAKYPTEFFGDECVFVRGDIGIADIKEIVRKVACMLEH